MMAYADFTNMLISVPVRFDLLGSNGIKARELAW